MLQNGALHGSCSSDSHVYTCIGDSGDSDKADSGGRRDGGDRQSIIQKQGRRRLPQGLEVSEVLDLVRMEINDV